MFTRSSSHLMELQASVKQEQRRREISPIYLTTYKKSRLLNLVIHGFSYLCWPNC